MVIKIEDIAPDNIACIRRIGPYGEENIKTMEELKKWARDNKLINEDSIILGIARDNPEITKAENCRYDVCIIVKDGLYTNDDNIFQSSIERGKYVVFKINHTAQDIKRAWQEIFAELFKLGVVFDETRPIMERYAEKLIKNDYCELCVPIK